MCDYKLVAAVFVIGILSGYGACYYFHPNVKTVTNTITVTKTTKQPSGAVEIETVTTCKIDKVDNTPKMAAISEVKSHKWLISGTTSIGILQPIAYGAQVQYRLLGPIYLGAGADTSGRIQGLLSIGF